MRIRVFLVLVATVISGLALAPPAHARAIDTGFKFGIEDDSGHSSLVGYSGFRYVRVTVRWWQVEAAPGHYDWSSVHAEVDLAAQLGLPVLARVFGTPDWASGAPARQCDPGNLFAKTPKQLNAPTSTGAYHDFMYNIAKTFPTQITAYELWNEPDYCGYWRGTPAQYKQFILGPGYQGLKDAGSDALIVGGALAATSQRSGGGFDVKTGLSTLFATWVGNGKGGLYVPLDEVSYHTYPQLYSPPFEMSVARAQMMSADAFVNAHAGSSLKGYWITEFAIPNDQDAHASKTTAFFDMVSNHPLGGKVFYFSLGAPESHSWALTDDDYSPRPRWTNVVKYLAAKSPPPLNPLAPPSPASDQPPQLVYKTFYGDLNGDRRADMCGRSSWGVICALSQGSTFGSWTTWTTDYADATGWAAAAYGSTLALADVNGDGKADVCGRGSFGVQCSLSTGASFARTQSWNTYYDDADGWGNAAYYRTIRFADINGDKKADICGRASWGVVCATSTGASFDSLSTWINSFDDTNGWWMAQYGATLGLADVTGDGKADICGRASWGVVCAASTGTSFGPAATWTTGFDDGNGWANPAYYQSVRYADANGDGKADVCARGAWSAFCILSDGSGFVYGGPSSTDFGNPLWGLPPYAPSIQFADVDGNGGADVCGRGPLGVVCELNAGSAYVWTGFMQSAFADVGGWGSLA